jgi:glycine/D-amino acid oxidase-like deaminating enzyme
MKVAVVGAGIHGASAAWALVRRGHSVTLFDQFASGHQQGSSHGKSRIVRKAYPDRFYTEIMLEAYPLWAELEALSGRKLLHEVGLLYFGQQDSEKLAEMHQGLEDLGVPNEVWEDASRFPELRLEAGEVGIFTPEAGWADADLALKSTVELAVGAGCEVVRQRVGPDDFAGFDRVAVFPGAWVKDWAPDLDVRVSLQTVCYVRGRHGGPVWIEDGSHWMYGFPSEGDVFKVAAHSQGPEVAPDDAARVPTAGDVELARDVARRRFGIAEPVIESTLGCLYTNTPDEDFRFRWLDTQTLLISACSGHGFKFGPWIGRVAADLLEGKRNLQDFGRFAC